MRTHIPQTVKRKDIQEFVEEVQTSLKDATLGYALMTLLDESDLGTGPRLTTQTINPRAIDLKYAKSFKRSVAQKGLQNKKVENAIVVGVRKEWVDMTSLQPMHEGIYSNMVVWTKPHFPTERSILFNGNHRLHYMKTEDQSRWFHHTYTVAKDNLAATTTDKEAVLRHRTTIANTQKAIREHGVWLVKFINLSEWRKYTIHLRCAHMLCIPSGVIKRNKDPSMLEHHLATNSPLANLEDTDDVKISQVLMMITAMRPAERKAHIQSLCAQLTPSSLLYKILKDKGLYVAAMKLLAWKHFHGMTAGAGITAGLLVSWLPVYGGVSPFVLSCMSHAEKEHLT
jgi:hypothetical protein